MLAFVLPVLQLLAWLLFSEQAMDILSEHTWPGNIRELKNVVERSVYRAGDDDSPVDMITLDPFESVFRPGSKPSPATATTDAGTNEDSAPSMAGSAISFPIDCKDTVQEFEIDLIKRALAQSQYNQKKTAEALKVTYHQLRGYMKKYDLFDSE